MIKSYPDKNSLKQVFDSELSSTILKTLCKNNGIMLLSNNKNDIVNTAHLFYWGFSDINQISDLMEDEKNYKRSFRLEIPISIDEGIVETDGTGVNDAPEDAVVDNAFSNFLSEITAYRNGTSSSNGISFETLSIDGQNNDRRLKATIAYKKQKRGRVKLLDEITHRFSFEAIQSDNGQMIIDIVFDDRSDIAIAKKLINDVIETSDNFNSPTQISLSALDTGERVDLFDRFLAYSFINWRVESVRNIKVQKETIIIDDDEAEEIENNFLTGIESALFSGSGLRTNPIIIDAVNKGYFFPKATIMFEHRRNAIKLLLDVSFNTDELLLEVSILATYDIEEGRDFKHPLSVEEQKESLSYFHSTINQIYNEIKRERTQA